MNTVILKPLGYRDPDRIAVIASLWKKTGPSPNLSMADFHDYHDQARSFEAMAYYQSGESAAMISGASAAEFVGNGVASAEFFKVFGVEPVIGRFFNEEELQPDSNAAVLISYSFWQSHFAGDPKVLGKTIRLARHTMPIVGVMPPGFRFPNATDVWIPANTIFRENLFRSAHNVQVVAKLKRGVSMAQAQAELTTIGDRLEKQYPLSNTGKNVLISGLRDDMVRDSRLTLYILLGAVGLVLLVACGNVANLLLARATMRGREIAVRSALGAGRQRIVRQLFTESLLLALIAGLAGLAIATAGSRVLVALAPTDVPRLTDTAVDGWVLGFAFGASLLACLFFGLMPAIRAARVDLGEALKQGSARGLAGGGTGLRRVLVIAEIALSVVLVASAGLLIRSFAALNEVALGFKPENVLVMETSVTASMDANQAVPLYARLIEASATIPGVIAVGASRVPPGRIAASGAYWIDQVPAPEQISVTAAQAIYSVGSPGMFGALGMELKRGRDFAPSDAPDAPFVAVINETLARRSFGGRDPIGHTIATPFDSNSPKPMSVIGVVADIRQRGPAHEPDAEIYMPFAQHPGPSTQLRIVARTAVQPEQLAAAFRRKAHEIAPDMPVKFSTMESRMAEIVSAPRFRTMLLSIFAALAVGLAMAGVYAVVSFMVTRRRGEIGLRMALGANAFDVQKMVLRQGIWMALAGLVLGIAGALAASHWLGSLLFGVRPTDPATYGAAAAVIVVVTLAASYVPARRAARVDPLVALRQD